jgi:carbon monoxide dehydrogenase subunit G
VKIEDSFRVEVPVEEAWKVLLDLERIAPCLPGAQLTEVEGDEYRGTVKIKVGPITAQYKGVAKIEEADEANRKVVLQAEGRDTRGQGNASATVVATLVADGDGTNVNIDTDLNITGKVAQFGRGVMADVSSKLLGQFADNLKADVLSGGPSAAGAAASDAAADEAPTDPGTGPTSTTNGATTSVVSGTGSAVDAGFASTGATDAGPRKIESKEAEPIDLMDAAGGSVGKRLAPVVAGVVALVVLRSVLRRRKRRAKGRRAEHRSIRHTDD